MVTISVDDAKAEMGYSVQTGPYGLCCGNSPYRLCEPGHPYGRALCAFVRHSGGLGGLTDYEGLVFQTLRQYGAGRPTTIRKWGDTCSVQASYVLAICS